MPTKANGYSWNDVECSRCGHFCNGYLMRTHPSYNRVRALFDGPEIPRTKDGRMALCHFCQRAAYFAKGYLLLLVWDLELAAADELRESAQGKSMSEALKNLQPDEAA